MGNTKRDRATGTSAPETATTETPGTSGNSERVPKVRATFHIPEDLFEEARDAVVHLSGPPTRLTLAELCETALRRELARLRKQHDVGERFPKRAADLKGGRPIGR